MFLKLKQKTILMPCARTMGLLNPQLNNQGQTSSACVTQSANVAATIYKQQRLRGLDTGAQAMRAWLMSDENNHEILEAQAIAELAQSLVHNAFEQAISTVEAEEAERERAAYAEAARAQIPYRFHRDR